MITLPSALLSGLMPCLRLLDAELAHSLALKALRAGYVPIERDRDDPSLEVRIMATVFPNPIGLAAGFDKDAVAVSPLMRLGFGFVEAGTVTRLPQAGNPKPRLFRLMKDEAVINRMGFNNSGMDAFAAQLAGNTRYDRPIGANIGINKDAADPERDYPVLVAELGRHVDYIVVNVSSPNTPGLRDLQSESRLRAILRAIAREVAVRPPVLIKLAPDLSPSGLEAVVAAAEEEGAAGLIISNTTIVRPNTLAGANRLQPGGLSGAPLFAASTDMLARAARLTRGRLVLIGCGGVRTGAHVLAKVKAGASLVQLYTAFSYAGPSLIPRIKRELVDEMRREGFRSISDAIGAAI